MMILVPSVAAVSLQVEMRASLYKHSLSRVSEFPQPLSPFLCPLVLPTLYVAGPSRPQVR